MGLLEELYTSQNGFGDPVVLMGNIVDAVFQKMITLMQKLHKKQPFEEKLEQIATLIPFMKNVDLSR